MYTDRELPTPTAAAPGPEAIKTAADTVAQSLDADVILYNGGIDRWTDRTFIDLCRKRKRRTNVLLILITEGGDPDVAYRISRLLQHVYTRFYCFVSGYCKSAGTLLVLGAHELIVSDHGELGPLDVQMAKKDEMWESESGLTVMTALTTLHEKARLSFEHFFIQTKIKTGGNITLRTATEIAAKLTTGLFAPVYQQIDPMHIGEAGRSMSIAKEYGRRLMHKSQNFTLDSLDFLISGYPTHSFVIDRMEARAFFARVRKPTAEEDVLTELLGDRACVPLQRDEPIVEFLSSEVKEAVQNAEPKNDNKASQVSPIGGSGQVIENPGGSVPALNIQEPSPHPAQPPTNGAG